MFIACCSSFFIMSLPVFYLKTEVWDQLLLASGGKPGGNRERHVATVRSTWRVVSNMFHPVLLGRLQFGEHIFQGGWFNHQLVNCWFGARWFGILRLIQILLVTFLGWLSDPCKCESRPPYTTLNRLVPDNHWGLDVYSRGLDLQTTSLEIPWFLGLLGKTKTCQRNKNCMKCFFWQSGHRNEIRNLTAKNHWLCLVALRQSNKDTVHSRQGSMDPSLLSSGGGVEARCFPVATRPWAPF